ncbi:hypothetical protein OIU34_05595 [Pararhizobium sp. BT-229]|uniref:hypothetical protein n=1 Tax=Pararhizobium sp. BT-229 TaxID=2986923 RepID=UPI0021F787E9|nr:hypothetical protein [Pararhizobium sp. BT-229]MCV9961369.1 hypothetical protein [Pararhizobium sp. BT-229]
MPPLAFYGGFEFAANRITEEYKLPRNTRNSVKHALTAASIYSALRASSIDKTSAEGIVLALGFFNEKLETYIKVGHRDSLGEQCKDLHNNWAGIVAAEWRLTQAERKSLPSIIAGLAETGTLMLRASEVPLQVAPQNADARTWFDGRKPAISKQVVGALDNTPSP